MTTRTRNRRRQPEPDTPAVLPANSPRVPPADRARVARAHMLARRLVRHCFRDLLEPFHGDMGHKISEPEMRRLMIALVNNVYTFLSIPETILADLPEPDWNEPQLDRDLVEWLLLQARRRMAP